MAPPRKATALVRGLDAALADLAALSPYGALTMETDPPEFIRSVISEIERLRRQEIHLLRLANKAADEVP